MKLFRSVGIALACALALAAGSVFAEAPRLEPQLAYVTALSEHVDQVAMAVNAQHADVQALAKMDARLCSAALTLHSGYLKQSAGAVHRSTLAGKAVLHRSIAA